VTVVGLLHPGEMGAAVGAALRERGVSVLWASAGRSPATVERAKAAGLEDAGDLDAVCRRCEVLLSICPPHAAVAVAQAAAGFAGTYVDANAIAPETAVREVLEETGVEGRIVEKLGDVKYVYTWDGERIFKVVSFFLLRAGRGRIGEIEEAMRVEVAEARWLPLDDGPRLLAYGGEREMAAKARDKVAGG